MKYEASQDDIFAWYEFKQDFQYDGAKVVRIETLEALALVSFSNTEPGGMATFIDKFQNYMAELDVIAPNEYSDAKKKRMLLTSIRGAQGVAHLIQTCRDSNTSFD